MKIRHWLSTFTLFREQGITIVSILTAIGMAISTLMLTGGGAGAPHRRLPGDGPGQGVGKKAPAGPWACQANLLSKAGIIGSVISWLLCTLGKTASWLAENLWILVIGAGALVVKAARYKLARPQPGH